MKSAARAGSKRRWTWPYLVPGSKRRYGKMRKGRRRYDPGSRRSKREAAIKEQL